MMFMYPLTPVSVRIFSSFKAIPILIDFHGRYDRDDTTTGVSHYGR